MTTIERTRQALELIDSGFSTKEACAKVKLATSQFYNARKKIKEQSTDNAQSSFAEETSEDWRDFAAIGLINAKIDDRFKVAAIRAIYTA